MNFKFVQYGGNTYPDGIKPELVEIAGHLDKDYIEDYPEYSLHTEYSTEAVVRDVLNYHLQLIIFIASPFSLFHRILCFILIHLHVYDFIFVKS